MQLINYYIGGFTILRLSFIFVVSHSPPHPPSPPYNNYKYKFSGLTWLIDIISMEWGHSAC